MNATINRQLFSQTVFDSGALGVLVSVLHQFSKPGNYEGTVLADGEPHGKFKFTVAEDSAVPSVNFDLAKLSGKVPAKAGDCACRSAESISIPMVSPKGYVQFFASRGSGYSATVELAGEKRLEAVYDSRKLEPGDLFTLTLLRPGRYEVTDKESKARGSITVKEPKGKTAVEMRALPPQSIEVSAKGFVPENTEITSTQGVIFKIAKPSRVVVEFPEKDEPPSKGPLAQWVKPLERKPK